MGERILNRNFDRARDDVIRGRTELAFHANRLALSIAVQNRGAFRILVELGRRDFFQRGQILRELLDAQRLTRR